MYCIIEKKPVFITYKRYNHLKDQVLKSKKFSNWSALDRAMSILDHSVANRIDEDIFQILEDKFKVNKVQFYKEWVEFDFIFDTISKDNMELITSLLTDFSLYQGNYEVKTDFEFQFYENIVSDFLKDLPTKSWLYYVPQREVLNICYNFFPKRHWWQFRNVRRVVSVNINLEQVKRIKGTLDNFWIYCTNELICCCENLIIYPILRELEDLS